MFTVEDVGSQWSVFVVSELSVVVVFFFFLSSGLCARIRKPLLAPTIQKADGRIGGICVLKGLSSPYPEVVALDTATGSDLTLREFRLFGHPKTRSPDPNPKPLNP